MDKLEARLLKEIADLDGLPVGAYNIRRDGKLDGRVSTAHIVIDTKTDKSGIDIHIAPGTKNESVHIPVIISQTGLSEMVYNDFFIGEDCDVDIVAGATYTSNGIINAVKDALSKAGGGGTDGALTGTADGFIGPITVEVTMDGDTITSVTVVDNSETLSIASGALEQIPEAIVAANSPDVDVVAGATYTSNGIMNAVKDAIGAAE